MVGESQGKAGKRRQWVRIEKEMARLDREALWLERVTVSNTGKNLFRTELAESRVLYLPREAVKPVTNGWQSAILGQYCLIY